MSTTPAVFQDQPYIKGIESCLALPLPESIDTLTNRLNNIVGRSIAELALLAQATLPPSNASGKGFVGQLIELYLGADGHNLSLPDFSQLDIELKTISVGFDLMPQAGTSICSMKLDAATFVPFIESPLYHKLSHMLFVLVFAPNDLPISDRFIVGYFYYKPSNKDFALFKADYEDIANAVYAGRIQDITPEIGSVLQLRQKTSAKQQSTTVRDADGTLLYTQPRNFCLRPSFTRQLCTTFLKEQGITEKDLRILNSYRQLIA